MSPIWQEEPKLVAHPGINFEVAGLIGFLNRYSFQHKKHHYFRKL